MFDKNLSGTWSNLESKGEWKIEKDFDKKINNTDWNNDIIDLIAEWTKDDAEKILQAFNSL